MKDVTDQKEAPVKITESQAKRLRTPMMGMIITMVVLTGGLAALWFINPEPDVTYTRDENVKVEAWYISLEMQQELEGVPEEEAAELDPFIAIAPEVPEGWTANYTRWGPVADHGVRAWEVGYTTDAVDFLGFAQTDEATEAWVNWETEQAQPTGTATFAGLEFEVRDEGSRQYFVLDAENNDVDGTTVVISTDAGEDEIESGITAIVEALGQEVEQPSEDELEDLELSEDQIEELMELESADGE